MRRAKSHRWLLAATVASYVVWGADGIKCWGANAITLQREGGEAQSCTAGRDRFDFFRYDSQDVCFEKCGGVTWFEGYSTGLRHFANPDGKRLCPSVVDQHK
jgi:hypothetical protein